jgi:hypothetical protein
MKPVIHYHPDSSMGNEITIERFEIITDEADPETVEIYVLDSHGERVEGGTFRMHDLAHAIYKFYNAFY